MRTIIFSFVFLLITTMVTGQNVLEITNSKSGKTRMLKQGAKLHFKTIHDSTSVKAKIVMIKDSVVTFYIPEFEDESPLMDVPIKNLKEIQKASTFHSIIKGVSYVTLPIGTFLFANGGLSLMRGTEEDKSQTVGYTIAGLGLAAISTLPFLIKPNSYKKSEGWEFKMGQKQ